MSSGELPIVITNAKPATYKNCCVYDTSDYHPDSPDWHCVIVIIFYFVLLMFVAYMQFLFFRFTMAKLMKS